MKWPEPLKYFYSKKGYPDNCVESANKMLEACKKAYEESHTPLINKCVICGKQAHTDQKSNGWRCQDHVLFGG